MGQFFFRDGTVRSDESFLVRFHPDGMLDSSFDTALIPSSIVANRRLQIAIDTSDRVLVGSINGEAIASRLDTSGAIDKSFGDDGSTVLSGPYVPSLKYLEVMSDGSVLAMVGDPRFNNDFSSSHVWPRGHGGISIQDGVE